MLKILKTALASRLVGKKHISAPDGLVLQIETDGSENVGVFISFLTTISTGDEIFDVQPLLAILTE